MPLHGVPDAEGRHWTGAQLPGAVPPDPAPAAHGRAFGTMPRSGRSRFRKEWSRIVSGQTGRFIDAFRDPSLLELSPALAEMLGETAAATGEPQFCLRRQAAYVLLGPQDMRLPDLPRGVAWLESRGLPVYRRVGGGSAVLLDGDCLSFAAAIPCRDIGRLDRNFTDLTVPVRAALADLGAAAHFGRAEGSYCEGPQDLVDRDGRKIAGVSQALRRGYALVSGMILVRQDPAAATALLQGFYAAAGSMRRLRASAVTSLDRILGRDVRTDEVHDAVGAALGRQGGWREGSLSAEERARAGALLAERAEKS